MDSRLDPGEMRRRVGSARVARLATVDARARPHLVPVCFAVVGEVAYTAVDHKPKRGPMLRRISNIEATRHACLLVDEYADDWSRLWWVRMDATGRLVHDPDEVGRAHAALIEKYAQYAERPPAGPVIALDIRRWSGWSAG
jgi:PPOX class probable F420-dependent enzyme